MKTALSLLTTVLLALSHQVYGEEVTITDWMIEMLDQVNAERATAGTHPLCYNDKVILAAEIHNQDMVDNNFFSHTGSDESSPGSRLFSTGYDNYSALAENIAFGQTTVTQVMNSWMNSDDHRANILNPIFSHFGVAWDISTNKWTQVFADSFTDTEGCMTLALSTSTPNRNQWLISTTGNSTEEAKSKDTILISTPFNTSNRDHAALVFEANCITPFDNDSYFAVDTTTPTSSAPDGFIQFNTTLEMNVTAINGTSYWNAFTDGTRGGWVEACVETYLEFSDDLNLGNDDAVQKVTFKNNVFNISVSLTATYDVDNVSVIRETAKGENLKTDYSEYINAYLCADTDPYAAPLTGTTYSQGDQITICVTDESGGIVQVEEFVNLVVAQEGNSDYNFILNTLYNPDITFVDCLDATASERRVCIAKIRALARFFASANPPSLTISGSVYVIHDGRRVRRNLRMGLPAPEKINEEEDTALVVSGRRDEEEEEGSGDFEVIASLVASTDDSAASSRIVGSAVGGLVSMAVGAAGATFMV